MKVLVNALSARMGGIVTYTTNLMRSFRDRGIDAVFAVAPEFPAPPGGDVIRIGANRMRPAARLAWEQTVWRRIIARHAPDVLFSSANFGVLRCSVPQVLLIREGGLFDPFYLTNIAPSQGARAIFSRATRRRLILASARASDIVFVPTAAMKQTIVNWAPDLGEKIDYSHYGTLLDHFAPAGNNRRWRQDGVLRLLYVSEYYPHKRPGMLSEAVARLNEAGLACRLTITMDIGRIASFPGGEEDYYLLARGVERNQVELVGSVPYSVIPSLYRDHDLLLFPSVAETFGHPLIEAMSIGLAIVAADRPVNREVCEDAARYFVPFSVRDLVNTIHTLDASDDLRRQMVQVGKERCAAMFGWGRHVDHLVSRFRQAAGGHMAPI